ncbi:hypothetical protein LTR62_005634 [Meristemomyces frigidus]|uniref:Uncharacterized protein n=1 Tax=Meristemomyces frigidus TaxID=1508187 RepID=A0AAN7YJ64_9PEZI|nr:hypothetical protein LTR62_005634 [Meristemomyces frigidus]
MTNNSKQTMSPRQQTSESLPGIHTLGLLSLSISNNHHGPIPPSPVSSEASGSSVLAPTVSDHTARPDASSKSTSRPSTKKRSAADVNNSMLDRSPKRYASVSTSADDDDLSDDGRRDSHYGPGPPGAKANKERQNRQTIAQMLQDAEDSLRWACELDNLPNNRLKSQSAANGASSGLRYDKKNLMKFLVIRSIRDINTGLRDALRSDITARAHGLEPTAMAAFNRALMNEYSEAVVSEAVYADTIFESPPDYARCTFDNHEKSCSTHPDHPLAGDWRACRFRHLSQLVGPRWTAVEAKMRRELL